MSAYGDDCTFVRERLELFLDGELAGSENLRFLTHLKECEECAGTWSDDEAVSEAIMLGVAPDVGEEIPAPAADVSAPRDRGGRPITHSSSEVLVLGSASAWWRLVATAAAASFITGLVAVGFLSRRDDAAALRPGAGVHVVAAGSGAVHRRPGDPRAVPLTLRAAVEPGAEIRTPDDARVVLGVGDGDGADRGRVVLAEGTRARFVGDGSEDAVALTVERGRVSVDVGDVECRVTLLALEVSGRDVNFDVWTPRDDATDAPGIATLAVSRGEVRATSSTEVRRVPAGETWYLMEGGELISDDAIMNGVFAMKDQRAMRRLIKLLETERKRRHELERILSRVVGGEGGTTSADEAVSAYVALQREAGLLDAETRETEMKRVTARLAEFGSSLSPVVERRFRDASGPDAVLTRRALVRLSCGLGLEGRWSVLRLASEDPARDVRATAIACLASSESDRGAELLARIASSESELELRLVAAEALAARGDDRGAATLVAEYRDTSDAESRLLVADRIARLEPIAPVRAFFCDVLRVWTDADGTRLLRTALAWVRRHDAVCAIPLVRDLVSRQAGAELLLLLQDTLENLERH